MNQAVFCLACMMNSESTSWDMNDRYGVVGGAANSVVVSGDPCDLCVGVCDARVEDAGGRLTVAG